MNNSSKLGEATFSEVFKFEMKNGEREVVKIIPLELEPSIEIDIIFSFKAITLLIESFASKRVCIGSRF